MSRPLLEVTNLKKHFPVRGGVLLRTVAWIHAVDGMSFTLDEEEILGLVGESGCGKTTVLRLLMRLIEPMEGSVMFQGNSIFDMKKDDLKLLRRRMAMVFQDPYSSLNPRMSVVDIVGEPFIIQGGISRIEREERVVGLLEKVGLSSFHLNRYPHEFSGGEKQRIGIARALAQDPKLVLADEPVSSLDVSVRAQVLNLLKDLHEEFKLSYLYVSHDLAVVKHLCDRTLVMYLGKPVEMGSTREVYGDPIHPYTKALISAVPVMDPDTKRERIILRGSVPTPIDPPPGCRFHPRCSASRSICAKEEPTFTQIEGGRFVACHLS